MIKSENAQPSVWVYVDVRNRDVVGYVDEAQERVAEAIDLPPGYSVAWSGQFEYAQRAAQRMMWVVPATIGIIFILRSEEHTSELQSLMRISYAVFCLKKQICI